LHGGAKIKARKVGGRLKVGKGEKEYKENNIRDVISHRKRLGKKHQRTLTVLGNFNDIVLEMGRKTQAIRKGGGRNFRDGDASKRRRLGKRFIVHWMNRIRTWGSGVGGTLSMLAEKNKLKFVYGEPESSKRNKKGTGGWGGRNSRP